ncbi:MAG: hypothetical protein M3Q48_09805 [Actinomycetota bacterium]|nr:hypothetical protein [Actinomycetota bacterium]
MSPTRTKAEPVPTEADVERMAAQVAEHRRRQAEAAQVAEERRMAAVEMWDRRALDAWDDAALEAEERKARDAFVAAVEADPVFVAWAHYRAMRRRRVDLLGEMQSVVNRLGINRRLPNIGPGEEDLLPALASTLNRLAAAMAGEDQDARMAAREAAGDEAAPEARA